VGSFWTLTYFLIYDVVCQMCAMKYRGSHLLSEVVGAVRGSLPGSFFSWVINCCRLRGIEPAGEQSANSDRRASCRGLLFLVIINCDTNCRLRGVASAMLRGYISHEAQKWHLSDYPFSTFQVCELSDGQLWGPWVAGGEDAGGGSTLPGRVAAKVSV
jgi:hypothetical protein